MNKLKNIIINSDINKQKLEFLKIPAKINIRNNTIKKLKTINSEWIKFNTA